MHSQACLCSSVQNPHPDNLIVFLKKVLLNGVESGAWQDADSFLISAARRKFDTGFLQPDAFDNGLEKTQSKDTRRPDLPPRCNSVLGVHAPDRGVDGVLRGGAESQLGLDYVDLEQLLLEKMQELKVAAPNGKVKGGKKARAGSADADRKGPEGEEEEVADEDAFAKRIQEVAHRPLAPTSPPRLQK